MSTEVKNVVDFIKHGLSQFDVILRRDKNETFNFHVKGPEDFPEILDYKEEIYSKHPDEGIIRIVKRIKDDVIFHQSDLVECEDVGTCFIVEFSEDLIHCYIVDLENTKILVEVNELKVVAVEMPDMPNIELSDL